MNVEGEFYTLYVPSMQIICKEMESYMKDYFKEATCEVINSPNLTSAPFYLAAPGICGNVTLVDTGGFGNLLPEPNFGAKFKLSHIAEKCNYETTLICGAGGGPFYEVGCNCELVANTFFEKRNEINKSLVAYVDKRLKNITVNATSQSFALLGQFFCCEGKKGEIISLSLKCRMKEGSIMAFLQGFLKEKYGNLDRPVGLGAVILMTKGKAKIHVMPAFSEKPLNTPKEVNDWLVFYTVNAPFVAVGDVLSHDPKSLKLRLEHFHGYTTDRKEAGHFHGDIDGTEVEYQIYLIVAERLLRQNPPAN